ncbi:MAG: hypothetical protein ACKV2O_01865 [Acidimicrobiales bacterium]
MSAPGLHAAPTLLGVLGRPVALLSAGEVVMAADGGLAADRSGAGVSAKSAMVSALLTGDWRDGPRWRWWVGAGDRWYRPQTEAAVRMTSADGTPVIQTSMRVPSGDMRVVSFAAMGADGPAVIFEVHNDSAGPVLFALVSEAVEPAGGRRGRFGGQRQRAPISPVQCSRPPDDVLTASSLGALAELLERQTTSTAATGPTPDLGSPAGSGAATAHLFALSAGARFRAVAGGPGEANPATWTASIPSAESVTAGWRRQVDHAGRVETPDESAAAQLMADRCHLLIDAGARHPSVVRSLAAWGHIDAAVERLDAALRGLDAPVPAGLAAALLDASVDLVAWCDDPARLARALAETVPELAIWLGRGPARHHTALDRFGAVGSADGGWQPWPPIAPVAPVAPAGGSAEVDAAARAEGGAATVAPALAAATRLIARRMALLEEPASGELVLLGGWQGDWRGFPIEVHRLPTHLGRVSLALRWHGPRPALLWQIDRRPGGAGEPAALPVLRCPVLDPAFVGRGWQGEALLG